MHKMKEEVILRILAQESPKSELQLQRCGKNKLQGPVCNFWKMARVNLELFFKFQGPEYKNLDRMLILNKYRCLFAKWQGLFSF
jgi:hypothetical protein